MLNLTNLSRSLSLIMLVAGLGICAPGSLARIVIKDGQIECGTDQASRDRGSATAVNVLRRGGTWQARDGIGWYGDSGVASRGRGSDDMEENLRLCQV